MLAQLLQDIPVQGYSEKFMLRQLIKRKGEVYKILQGQSSGHKICVNYNNMILILECEDSYTLDRWIKYGEV
jgi:hypothetical protein